MKKAFKFIGILFGSLFSIVAILLIVDVATSVDYDIYENKEEDDSYYIKTTTETTDEDDLREIVEDIEGRYDDKDAVWLWIYDTSKDDNLLAKARIPFNKKGQMMIGAENNDYIFEIEKK